MKLTLRKVILIGFLFIFMIFTEEILTKLNKFNKFKNRLKNRNKNKKCNPYKNGPAEWKTVEYANSKHFDDKYGPRNNQLFGDNDAISNVEYYYDRYGKKQATYNDNINQQQNRIGYDPRQIPNYDPNGMLGYVDDRIYE